MSKLFQRQNFLWAGLETPFVVEAKVGNAQITLRTWTLSENAPIASVLPIKDALAMYGKHAEPFEIDSDLAELREIKKKYWIPAAALGGKFDAGGRSENLYLKPISQVGFSIEKDVIGSTAWSDYAIWTFNAKRDGSLSMPFNRYISTYASKQHRDMLLISRHEINILLLNVPFARDNFDGCTFVLKYNNAFGCAHNFENYKDMPVIKTMLGAYNLESSYGFKALFPSLRLSGPDKIEADRAASYCVEMYSKNTDTLVDDEVVRVYLESHAGYLPRRQVEIINGTATFPFYALGLSPGDQVKLKVGWRNYSGADEKIITVI